MKEFVWEYLQPLAGSKGLRRQLASTQLVSTVACRDECVRGLLEMSKVEILEANCGLSSVPPGWLSW